MKFKKFKNTQSELLKDSALKPRFKRYILIKLIIVFVSLTSLLQAQEQSSWPAEVNELYKKIIMMPDNPQDQITHIMVKLAQLGPAARGALEKIAANSALPEGHRALSGYAVGDFAAFDPVTLKKLCHHSNNYVKETAAIHLAELGGSEARIFLQGVIKKYPFLAKEVNKALSKMPQTARISRPALKLLNQLLNSPDRKLTAKAQVYLAEYYPREASWAFLKMVDLMVNKGARIHCAIGLAYIYRQNLKVLKSLTGRKNDKYVRGEAVLALTKLGEPGRKFIRELLQDSRDPMAPHFKKILAEK